MGVILPSKIRRYCLSLALGAILLLGSGPAQSQPPRKLTLKECYQLALNRSETVAIAQEQIVQARARYEQALGAIFPKIAVLIQERLQDPATQEATDTFETTFVRLSTPSIAVNFKQPLFHGLQEYYAFKINRADRAQKALDKRNVERLLLQDVATVFFTIAAIERDIQTTERVIQVSRNQVGELKKRVELGKNRESETILQEANEANLEAELERKKGERRVAYDALSFLTGLDPQPPIQVTDPLGEKLLPLENYTGAADHRVDVLAAREGVNIAKGEVKVIQGELYPQLDLDANYYPYRVGFLAPIKWDVTFNATVPIINWETFGRIDEAKSRTKQAELQAELTRRLALKEIKQTYDNFISSRNQLVKYRVAVAKSLTSYQLQFEDFKKGLVNNLELLIVQQSTFDVVRNRDTVEIASWLDWLEFQVVTGALP